MKDIKTAKQFNKLFTDKELTVLSIEQKMQLYAEYYLKAKVESVSDKIKEVVELAKCELKRCSRNGTHQEFLKESRNAIYTVNKLLNDL